MAITRHLVPRQSVWTVNVAKVCVETDATPTRFLLKTKLLFGSWHLLLSNILNQEIRKWMFWFHMQEEIYRYIQLCILYMYSYYIFFVGFFFFLWVLFFIFAKKKCKFLIQADKNIAVYVWLANINYFYKRALRSNIVTVCFDTTHFQKISHFENYSKSIQRTLKKNI